MSPVKITLCLGSSCYSRGNRNQVENLRQEWAGRPGEVEVELKGSLCLGRCAEGPVVLVDGETLVQGPDTDLAALVRDRLAGRVPV